METAVLFIIAALILLLINLLLKKIDYKINFSIMPLVYVNRVSSALIFLAGIISLIICINRGF